MSTFSKKIFEEYRYISCIYLTNWRRVCFHHVLNFIMAKYVSRENDYSLLHNRMRNVWRMITQIFTNRNRYLFSEKGRVTFPFEFWCLKYSQLIIWFVPILSWKFQNKILVTTLMVVAICLSVLAFAFSVTLILWDLRPSFSWR